MVSIRILHDELDKFDDLLSGFSLLIESGDVRVLFDVSLSGQIFRNAKKAGTSLDKVDFLVLSHGHIDHVDALKDMDLSFVGKVIAHPACFDKKFFEGEGEIGSPLGCKELENKVELILSREPYWIKDDEIVFLGEIPRVNSFEAKNPIGYLIDGSGDFVLDDSAIAIKTSRGLVVVSGCSHSGICNILEYAKKVTGEDRIFAVVGGFHLFDKELTDKTVDYFKDTKVSGIYPLHCLDDYAFGEFEKIGAKRVKTLDLIEL